MRAKLLLNKPILIGFSGGEDSTVLIDILQKLNVSFHLAHFDHGWREESREEASELKKWAESQGLIFHTQRGSGIKSELEARKERYNFFKNVFFSGDFQALVLAHHQNDQAETVLKRVLEGAHLENLKGMELESFWESIPIWRPMLRVPKKEILAYLEKNKLKSIDDPTNQDPKYLRARMREQIIPMLSEHFGKQVLNPLSQIGEYGAELFSYLKAQTQKFPLLKGPFGVMWDFESAHPIEARFLLNTYFKGSISSSLFKQILKALSENASNQKVVFNDQTLIIDRKKIFYLNKELPKFSYRGPLREMDHGPWEIRLEEGEKKEQTWKDLWLGSVSIYLEPGSYDFSSPTSYHKKKLSAQKVPAFLRDVLPVITPSEQPVKDLVTSKASKSGKNFLVSIAVKEEKMVT